MKCDICGQDGAKIRKLPRSYGKGARLFVIEDVPVVSCPNCGESYMTSATIESLERLKSARKSRSSRRSVQVAKYVS